jgi:hypothetical protein
MSLRAAALLVGLAGSAVAGEVMTLQWESGLIPLEPGDIEEALVQDGVLSVKLEETLARDFADLTEILVGEAMAVLICGEEIARPVVRERIGNGTIRLDLGTRNEAARNALTGTIPCAEFRADG